MKTAYTLRYLPLAREDLQAVLEYHQATLQAPLAAGKLLDDMETALLGLQKFPYARRIYQPLRPLVPEYRLLPVRNYAVFYTVLEPEKIVEIHRIVYMGRDLLALPGGDTGTENP